MLAVAAALPVALSSGCAVDDNDSSDPATSDESQAVVTGACKIYRPYGWSVGLVSCMEKVQYPFFTYLPAGDQVTFYSGFVVGKGQGWVTVQCDANGDGRWVEIDKSCQRIQQ